MSSKYDYDAIVVGSGATGGWAAKELAEAGLTVLILESGGPLNPLEHFHQHTWPYELKYGNKFSNEWLWGKRKPIQSKVWACDEYSHHFFIDDIDNPYTTPKDSPYVWVRGALVGGRTNVWGRQTYRMSDYELKAASIDGYDVDWPISYSDLAPYYDKVEDFIGVSGSKERLAQLPDGNFLPPMQMTCGERLLKKAVETKWRDRRVIIGRTANLTAPKPGREACHYSGNCYRGCLTWSFFSSPGSTLPAAFATGKAKLRPNSIVRRVIVGKNARRASGVEFIDTLSKQSYKVSARVVVLAASTIASTRILLNSKSREYPNGLGNNSSGLLGKYLTGHVHSVWATGLVPQVAKYRYDNDDGRANQIYIPRFRNLRPEGKSFLRGYGIEGAVKRKMLPTTITRIPGFGSEFKHAVREAEDPAPFWLSAFGEVLPSVNNKVELDDKVVDAFGIPVPRIDFKYSDNEKRMAEDMMESILEIADAAKFEVLTQRTSPGTPGLCVHEVGTARMGHSPSTSVLNKHNCTWDVDNVYVTDGACYVSVGVQNPTLTMMALTVRACEHILYQFRTGNL